MLNVIWLLMIVVAVIAAVLNGRMPEVVASVTDSAKFAFQVALGLVGIMAFWLGLMRIAEQAGLIQLFGKLLKPIMVRLFPEVDANDLAMGTMTMNIAANMLGLANAATPFGLKAMQDLQRLNPNPTTATNAMCMFLAINTSSVQLIPATAIAYLVAGGASRPTDIIATSLIATSFSTVVAIVAAKLFERAAIFRAEVAQ